MRGIPRKKVIAPKKHGNDLFALNDEVKVGLARSILKYNVFKI